MNRILVTGGAGFIGSHVVDALIEMGQDVTVLDDLSGGARENLHPRAGFVLGSVTDHQLVRSLFQVAKFSHVFHLAAYAAEGLSSFIKRFNYNNNLIGSVNLLNAAITYGAKRVVFTSSIAVYGSQPCPMTEEMIPMPVDSYGIAKYAVERELAVCQQMFGLEYVIFRPHNVFGERQNLGDRYRNVVGIFMNQLMKGDPLTIFGDGEQTRAFTYVGDVAPVIARSAFVPQARNQIFNIGADQPLTVNHLSQLVAEAMGVPAVVRHVPSREEVHHAYCSHAKIEALLGYAAKTPVSEGLRRMAAWAKAHGARQTASFGEIEILKNLPSVWLEKAS